MEYEGWNTGVLDMIGVFFQGIWDGLSNINIPGTNWSMTGFILAIFMAGFLGLIMKHLFRVFNSHLDKAARSGGGRKDRRSGRKDNT